MDARPPFDRADETVFLVRYGELGLKSRAVRRRFIHRLVGNLEQRFLSMDCDCYIETTQGRIYLYPGDFSTGLSIVSTTFGIVSFSPAVRLESFDMDDIGALTVKYSRWLMEDGDSFAVRTKRTGTHSYTSQDMNVFMGDVILRENEGRGLRVDLGSPDRTLFIEVRDNVAYLFHEKIRGPGGLPYGSSGMSICALGNRESLLAAYLMMKRGNLLYFIYIPDLFPDPLAGEEVIGFLNGFLPNPVLHEIEGAAGENILLRLDAEATKRGASAVVVGFGSDRVLESIEQGQFAPIEHPVFYPLVGLGEDEVKTRLESLTTGEYSKGDGAGR